MRQRRYRSPEPCAAVGDEPLPTGTVCTILVRQSTAMQAERYVNSAEVNPSALVAEARRHGFDDAHIRLVEDDMGIGAYSTTIEDRPGLRRWLFEDLPKGESLVVLTSHEDRLFRDQHETEHNRFIAQAAKYGGWAICGRTVYNFRRRFDQDRFRWACRASKEFVEGHIKARLHPANQRSAMRGCYPGGQIHLGYIVDYDPRSPTYKHYIRYEPHAALVEERIYRTFAQLAQPTLAEVVRQWEREGLVWPFFGPEVDPRVPHVADASRTRDEARGGYVVDWRQVQNILTDVTYLGYRVRQDDYAKDAAGQPLLCHPALVDADLFWYCYDRLVAERPPWPWVPPRLTMLVPVARARRSPKVPPGTARFLAHGRVRCAVHGKAFSVDYDERHGSRLACNGATHHRAHGPLGCPVLPASHLEPTLCEAFVEQLTLDERDLAELARLIDQRVRVHDGQGVRLRRELTEAQTRLQRALEQGLREENALLAEELLAQAREAKLAIAAREADMAALSASQPISPRAWHLAQRVEWVAQRIRGTFLDWSREAQARVIGLGLEVAVLGYVNRRALGVWMRWQGGAESRREVLTEQGKRLVWSEDEKAALRRYYWRLTWDALHRTFPLRTRPALETCALELGVRRGRGPFVGEVPAVFGGQEVFNTMAEYGFPLRQGAIGEDSLMGTASARGATTRRRGRAARRR